jgi:NADH-quinone oxidoreductase subunit J
MQIVFILVAAATLGSALMVVTSRNLVRSALWLVAALFGVAVIYGTLSAGFLAVAQVVVYIGAIAVLMIYAIMLTRNIARPESGTRFNANWVWGLLIAVVLFVGLAWMLSSWPGFTTQMRPMSELAIPRPADDPLTALGIALVSPEQFILAFELASVLLLAALVGAIVVAWDRK